MKTLVLIVLLFCSVQMFGQFGYVISEYAKDVDYVITKYEHSSLPSFYTITPPDADSLMKAVRQGKTQYGGLPIPWGHAEFWSDSFAQIRNRYLSSADLQSLREHSVTMGVELIFDDSGTMKYIEASLKGNMFDVISMEQLVSMYRALWKIKVPMKGEFDHTQYYKGYISFLRYN